MCRRVLVLFAGLLIGITPALGIDYFNPDNPLIFANSNTLDASSLVPTTTLSSYPVIPGGVQVNGTGGTLNGQGSVIAVDGVFTGTGTLTADMGTSGILNFRESSGTPLSPAQSIPFGITLKSGGLYFNYGAFTLSGPFALVGDATIQGNINFTSNSITGISGTTLNLDTGFNSYIFSGSGFTFNADIDPDQPSSDVVGCVIALTNTSGTQTFAGIIGDVLYREGGGTTKFTNTVDGNFLYLEGGTVVLSGTNGAVTASRGMYLEGGTLVLDNGTANNNNRVLPQFAFYGGTLVLKGLNGGTTAEYNNYPRGSGQTTGPVVGRGENVLALQVGTGAGSSVSYTYGGIPTSYNGTLDFQGLGANAKVFFNGMPAGPMNPWATFNGIDFANYDTTNGVVAMPAAGRPTQINGAAAHSYVLASSAQNTLTGDASVYGVTMNTGGTLDLGGHTLNFETWIQNGAPATITNGKLFTPGILENDHYYGALVFTTNADLTVSVPVSGPPLLKNGSGTLTFNGAEWGTPGVNSAPQIEINQGTLVLNSSTPYYSYQSFQGNPTILIGSAANSTAVLSLQGDNQFLVASNPSTEVSVQVLQAGQFLLNHHDATLGFLEVDGGKVDLGGATLSTSTLYLNPNGIRGQILNGTLAFTGSSPAIVAQPFYPNQYQQAGEDVVTISSTITSSGSLTVSGAGTVALTGSSNSFPGGLVISGATVAIANSGALGTPTQPIQLTSGGLRADSTGTLTIPNPVVLSTASFAGSPITFSSGIVQSGTASLQVGNTTTIVGYVNNSSSGDMDKHGAGTLILSGQGSGTSTGTFNLDNGVLAFDSDHALPSAMMLNLSAGVVEAVNAPHTISNRVGITGDVAFDGSEPITFSAAGNTIGGTWPSTRQIYVNASAPVTINNLTGLTTTLLLGGNGTLTLTGTSQFAALSGSGPLQIQSGTLSLGSGTYTGVISGNGTLSKIGSGTLALTSPAMTRTGTTTVSGGTLVAANLGMGDVVNSGSLTLTSNIAIANTAHLTVTSGTANSVSLNYNGYLQVNALTVGGVDYPYGQYTVAQLNSFQSHGFTAFSNGSGFTGGIWVTPPSATAITNGPPPATGQVGTFYSFAYTATGSANPTFSLVSGSIPGVTLTSNGLLSGTPTTAGTYNLTVQVGNSSTPYSRQSFTVTILSTFSSWQHTVFNPQQLTDPTISGPAATPVKDGVPNLLKYLFDIDPIIPMPVSDRTVLSSGGLTTLSGTVYLTLTYRQNPFAGGLTVNLQTSPDLQNWTTVTPGLNRNVGSDPATGDPLVQLGVPTTTGTAEFIRLDVTTP